jgi:protein phosphatase
MNRADNAVTTPLEIPELSLVVLVGASGSGKSTFARRHFEPTEVLSSDWCRGLVSDDETSQAATKDAFDVLHYIAAKRLAAGRLTVVDATNVQREARQPLVQLARQYHCLPAAIVFDLPERLCVERNEARPDRNFGARVVASQRRQLRRSLKGLKREGFRHIFTLRTPEEVDAAVVVRTPLWNDKRGEHGPLDIIGDVHGCCDELEKLLAELGYRPDSDGVYRHPEGRKAVFLGDLVDRGPRILDTLALVRNMIDAGQAYCVPGNHDVKLLRKLRGRHVRITHGLDKTLAEIDALPEDQRQTFTKDLAEFLRRLVSHYVFDDGRLVVAHAGLRAEMHGRGSAAVKEFALYGETTGETDEFGLPVRHDWAADYRGPAMVVYGHTPVPETEWLNRTINIDTGCVFGGKLTALRYPERELISVAAAHTYCEPAKPFLEEDEAAPGLTAQQQQDDLLDLQDVTGKRIISTRLRRTVVIREENSAAALEVMSRFAVNPKWLIYLPPTMSPPETTAEAGLLEHPAEAFDYFRHHGVGEVICQEKHMGSRAVVIVCRDADVARQRFGIVEESVGIVYTRTGRRFFNDADVERELLDRLRAAMGAAGLWEELETDWGCLDCELMPWSAKARELLREQYAAVGSASRAALADVTTSLRQAAERVPDAAVLLERYDDRRRMAGQFTEAYRRYCWDVAGVEDLRLAPFHVLATEGKVHVDKDHVWHMDTIAAFCRKAEPVLLATPYRIVDVTDPASRADGIRWWEDLTGQGGEGMVVKPLEFIARGRRGLVQPALKCRGREYLRIIYGPEYTWPANLERLRNRSLAKKRAMALAEFALGVEALERFVRREPLRRVHECVFGVLAMESQPVDPRL